MPSILLSRSTQLEILYDKETIEFASGLLSRDSVVIDVGANSGLILRKLAKLTPNGQQIAFEPIPFFAHYLRKKYPNSDIRELALSDHAGAIQFYHTFESPALSTLIHGRVELLGQKFKKMEVLTDTLDRQLLNAKRIDFIKIDVEGHEIEVLKGARATIEKFRPALVIEVNVHTEVEISSFLTKYSYEVSYLLEANQICSIAKSLNSNCVNSGKGYLKAEYKVGNQEFLGHQ